MTVDGLTCSMDGYALLISILDGEAAATLREDGTLEQIVGKYLENPSQYLEVDTIGT